MDNASKALIMAGAILIAVALVSLGVYLYQQAAGTISDGTRQVDASQMLMLNQEIEKFKGTSVRGSELTQLSNLMRAYNAEMVFPTDLYLVNVDTVGSGDLTEAQKTVDTNFRDSGKFNVTIDYGTGTTQGWVIGARYDQN